MRAFLSNLHPLGRTRRLRVELADVDEPIDLLTSRFKFKTEVHLDSYRNIHVPSIWDAFDAALQRFDQG